MYVLCIYQKTIILSFLKLIQHAHVPYVPYALYVPTRSTCPTCSTCPACPRALRALLAKVPKYTLQSGKLKIPVLMKSNEGSFADVFKGAEV